jgi:hypothetical protein
MAFEGTAFERMVIDDLFEEAKATGWPPRAGDIIVGHPREFAITLNYTCLRGGSTNVYRSLIYNAPKWGFLVSKVDEWMEVNPNFPEIHNQVMEAKHRLEGSIKSGLGSAMQALTDFELISHDYRRYKEIVDYFIKGKKDEHVLRSMFVDRVDAHTGDMFSMIGMAKRWPTIIADFMKMKDEWEDIDAIRKELDVSQAEATVLKTKNELYKEWKKLFKPVVLERYARMENLVKARKKSVEEYRSWIKPYLAKYKALREATEGNVSGEGRDFYVSNAYTTPAMATQESYSRVRIWVYKPFWILDKGRPPGVTEEGRNKGFQVDPYDRKWAQRYHKIIEERYGVKVDLKQALNDLAALSKDATGTLYYVLFDIRVELGLTAAGQPEGVSQDDITFHVWLMVLSLNAMLIYLMEKQAREKWLQKYMDEIIGVAENEEDIINRLREEMGEAPEGKGKGEKKGKEEGKLARDFRSFLDRLRPGAETFWGFFVKPGPYEPVFFERASKMYMRAAGGHFGQVVGHLKKSMGIE